MALLRISIRNLGDTQKAHTCQSGVVMTTEDVLTETSGLEGRDCVPFFKDDKSQIKFEFWYLIALFIAAVATMLFLQLYAGETLNHSNKLAIFSVIGGFLGGWVYDAKWFYRVTARGRSNQYKFPWHPHKFYWRVLTPFLTALVAFCTYLLATEDFLPIAIKHKDSAHTAFAVCFLLGYFSDLVLSRLAAWAERFVPKSST